MLPLVNLTGRADDEYFADGMTEMLTTELSSISALRIVSRQSVRAFKGSDRPLRDLSELLGVDAVLEGSVLRAGDRIRVLVQLVRVEPEEHLWADAYDRELSDVLTLYSEIARSVAAEVQARLTNDERQRLSAGAQRSVDPAAYDSFLRGVALFGKSQYGEALDHFGKAVARDPELPEAHAWMAAGLGRLALVVGPQLGAAMKQEVEMALRLGPDLQWAHTVHGSWLAYFTYDWRAADSAFQRAINAKRRDNRALQDYALFLVGQCRFEETAAAVQEWLHLDPGVAGPHFALGYLRHKMRRFEESTEQLEFTLAHWPEYVYTPIWLACNYAFLGRADEAIGLMRRAVEAAPNYSILLGYAGACSG